LSEYVDYNKDVLLFGHAPEPIEEDKTWRLVGGNTNGIKPYGGSSDLISVMERLKSLQTGTVAFQETNLEWHNKGYQD
jgi:ABC-type enterochelin transport system ATPase subunit